MGLRSSQPYTVLWQNLKRQTLTQLGFVVVTAPARRVDFEAPHERPHLAPADHAGIKEGKWREPVRVEAPYARDPGDAEADLDRSRERAYVGSATYEQGFGRVGTPAEEVPLPADDEALQCPDMVTKAEWDAIWPEDRRIQMSPIAAASALDDLPPEDERLTWSLPERAGGLRRAFR